MLRNLAFNDLELNIETLCKPVDDPYTYEVCKFYADANLWRRKDLELDLYGCLDAGL